VGLIMGIVSLLAAGVLILLKLNVERPGEVGSAQKKAAALKPSTA